MFPNEATYLHDWTGTSKLSYGDFLRAKQFERSFRYAIDNQMKTLVATNEELSARGVSVLSEELERGFTLLSQDIAGVGRNLTNLAASMQEGFADVTNILHWGFSEVLVSLGHMNDSLDALKCLSNELLNHMNRL